jgi:hypothetical protein
MAGPSAAQTMPTKEWEALKKLPASDPWAARSVPWEVLKVLLPDSVEECQNLAFKSTINGRFD